MSDSDGYEPDLDSGSHSDASDDSDASDASGASKNGIAPAPHKKKKGKGSMGKGKKRKAGAVSEYPHEPLLHSCYLSCACAHLQPLVV